MAVSMVSNDSLMPPPRPTFVAGVDVGQIRDHSAICVVRYDVRCVAPGDPLFGELPRFETSYVCLGAQRVDLGTSYVDVAKRVNQLMRRLYDRDSRADLHVVADSTGVGEAVVELLRTHVIPQALVTGVVITGGERADVNLLYKRTARCSKVFLVSRLQSILQSGRLHLPQSSMMADLVSELRDFEIRTRPESATPSSGAFTVGSHDDLAIALGLATCSSFEESQPSEGPAFDALPSPVLGRQPRAGEGRWPWS